MAELTTLHDEVVNVATTLTRLDTELARVSARLRDLAPEHTGPRDASASFAEVVDQLARTLDVLAEDATTAARAVRPFTVDPELAGGTRP